MRENTTEQVSTEEMTYPAEIVKSYTATHVQQEDDVRTVCTSCT